MTPWPPPFYHACEPKNHAQSEARCILRASFMECGGGAQRRPRFRRRRGAGKLRGGGNHAASKRRRARVPSCRRTPYQIALRLLRLLLFTSERLTEDNEGNENPRGEAFCRPPRSDYAPSPILTFYRL